MAYKAEYKTKRTNAARILVSIFVWLVIWMLVYHFVHQPILVPSPFAVMKRVLELLGTAPFWKKTVFTLLGITAGYFLGVAGGVLLAVLTAASHWLSVIFRPALAVIKSTPVVSFIILALVWMEKSAVPVFISFLMVLPLVWANLTAAIRETDAQLLEMARTYHFSRKNILRYIYIPSVLPALLSALTTAIGFAWKAGIAAEVISTPKDSIGAQLYNAKVYLETVDLFAWTLVVILLSLLFEKGIVWAVHRLHGQKTEVAK